MNFKHLTFKNDEGIITVGLNRPKVNALNGELLGELGTICDMLKEDRSARVLVLRSELEHFCAGADLKERQGMSEEDVKKFVKTVIGGTIHRIGDIGIPTIAAVNGIAYGGGCELALACDFRIFSDDAKVSLKETSLGIIPGAGGTQRLPRLIGYSNALLWILTARVFSAQESLQHGVCNLVVPAGELHNEANKLAQEINANAPIAVRLAKKAVRAGLDVTLKEGLDIENECYNDTIPTRDRLEALKAFNEKRKPKWNNN